MTFETMRSIIHFIVTVVSMNSPVPAAEVAAQYPLVSTRSLIMSETIAFIVHLPGKPEARDELYSSLIKVLDEMSNEPDFVNTYLHRSTEDPDTLVLYETWACSAQYFQDYHLKKSYRVEYEGKLKNLLKSERRFEWLDLVKGYERDAA
jgi:quinol monooxygenase YgiN